MTLERTSEQKNQFKPNANRLGISMLVMFGSAATLNKKPDDIDVAVFLTDTAEKRAFTDFGKQSEVIEATADFLGVSSDKLDTVFVGRHTAPLLAYHIARDGKLLFGSERHFMRFRLLAVKIYQDTWKFRDALWLYLEKAYAR